MLCCFFDTRSYLCTKDSEIELIYEVEKNLESQVEMQFLHQIKTYVDTSG